MAGSLKPGKKFKYTCPEDKSTCDCLTACPTELREDCPDKGNPDKCCQGCMAEEADLDGGA